MPENGKSIYKICRLQAGYTQEHAAELLGCSVRALARYESGEAVVPDPVASRMMDLYNSDYLGRVHLRQVSQVAAVLLPPVEDCGIQTAALRFFNQMDDMEDLGRSLLKIVEDGRIDPEERLVMNDLILPKLEKLACILAELCTAAERGT